MRYDCDMICDLLPLYVDGVCSKASADAVEEHLAQCGPCSRIYNDMKRTESTINTEIIKERDEVLVKQARTFKRRSAAAGAVIGAIFSVPILICLIVNLATGAGLTWFFIVLTAMFIPASLTVVPLIVTENKGLWTLGAFTASLLTLLGVCCIYSGGSWWFVAASSIVFGLSVPFTPFIVGSKPVRSRIKKHRGLLIPLIWSVTFILMLVCIGIRSESENFFRYALAYTIPTLAYVWTIALLIVLPKWSPRLRLAACIFASALFYFLGDSMVLLLLGRGIRIPTFDFTSYDSNAILDSVTWTVFILGTVIAGIIAAAELHRIKKNNKKK
ncbi:MAG: zf-HC2 domain-containing protein [Ruminococcus sp.]|nr:zf-HC2 domain-containing protein [Ruminococcus sp.]